MSACDPTSAGVAGRQAEGGVVLGAAVDVVEGEVIVRGGLVELGHRQVGHEAPVAAAVPALVNAAVIAVDQVVGVVRVDPQGVVVHVLAVAAHALERGAAVIGHLHPGVHGVDAVDVLRIGDDLIVILGAARDVVAALVPGGAGVGAAVEAALVTGGFDDGVDHVGVGR